MPEQEQSLEEMLRGLGELSDSDKSEEATEHLRRGIDLWTIVPGNEEEALKEFDTAISLDPEYADAYYWKGAFLFFHKNYDPAVNNLEKAIEIDPKHKRAHNFLGLCFERKGEFEQAAKVNRKLIDLLNHPAPLPAPVATPLPRADLQDATSTIDVIITNDDELLVTNPLEVLYGDLKGKAKIRVFTAPGYQPPSESVLKRRIAEDIFSYKKKFSINETPPNYKLNVVDCVAFLGGVVASNAVGFALWDYGIIATLVPIVGAALTYLFIQSDKKRNIKSQIQKRIQSVEYFIDLRLEKTPNQVMYEHLASIADSLKNSKKPVAASLIQERANKYQK